MNGNGHEEGNTEQTGAETTNFGGDGGSTGTGTATAGGTHTEEFRLSGEDIMGKIRQIIDEGNARRIIVRNAEGHNLIEVPLTAGVIGAALLPVYAALGAAIALAANLTIVVEKRS